MRKVIVSNIVSLNGYIAGPNNELDWHIVNDEFLQFAENMLNSVDCILYGRITYQMMSSYWPSNQAKLDTPAIADKMNSLTKIIFSKTLEKVEWGNSILVKGNIKDTVIKLKTQPGKDMVIFGSGNIVSSLTQLGLIDEYRVIINPVILGSGKAQFNGNVDTKKLKLIDVRKFDTGVVILSYQPIQ
jgi:dihydrofolate reductase